MMADMDDLPAGKILIGERDYERALAHVVAHAEKSLCIFDPDLSRGAFNSLQLAELLQQFLAKGPYVKMQMIVHDAYYLNAYGVRILKLLSVYGHQMEIRVTDASAHIAQDAMVIADGTHYLHRFHIQQARFKYMLNQASACKPLLERFEELVEASPTLITATTLGL
jgi:hypothetical protein